MENDIKLHLMSISIIAYAINVARKLPLMGEYINVAYHCLAACLVVYKCNIMHTCQYYCRQLGGDSRTVETKELKIIDNVVFIQLVFIALTNSVYSIALRSSHSKQ
jgi:hypothetical protein